MAASDSNDPLLGALRHSTVELVRREGRDLTVRQLATFLVCYLESDAQTVRGLAATLNVGKPAVTRTLNRLAEFDFVRRRGDPRDRRSILVQRTRAGLVFLKELHGILDEASAKTSVPPPDVASEASRD
jgi:DNA-binding MarR family transcriptional regulator